MRKIIFWAESLNMHTSCMFEELGKVADVTAVYYNRGNRDFGDLPLKNINLVKISNREEVDKIIDVTKDCIHVNRALKLYDSESIIIFNYALRRMLKENYFVVSLFLEQYYYWGIKGLLRILKWGWLFNFGYARKLKALGCCGRTGIEAHRKAFVSRKKLFDFIYTVPTSDSYLINEPNVQCNLDSIMNSIEETHIKRFVFIGQLRERKSIIELIDVFNSIDRDYKFYIIGEGLQKEKVIEAIANNDKICYLGKLKPIQVRQVLNNSDVLILPSKLEGWGCVVNEALMCGCRVITSSVVGARALIDKQNKRGQIFENLNWSDLKLCILREIDNMKQECKSSILDWSQNIMPKREAEYFLEILDYLQGNKKQRPHSPWD